jgi:hypothetical protein
LLTDFHFNEAFLKTSLRSISLLSALVLLFTTVSAFGQAGLLISQIYGGGGNSSASYSADFVEIYNPTSSPISTAGLSIQYASAAGNFTQAIALTSATIQPGHYFLVQTTTPAATPVGASLPIPDTSGSAPNLSATIGKVALVNGTAALTGDTTCPLILADTAIIDLVGYGSTASCFKGSAPAPGPSATNTNTQSIIRTVSSTNTNNNSADFTILSPPNPRNSSFAASGSLSATGSANPASVIAGQTTVLTVTVTPATSPTPSTNIAVTGDLRLIGGSQTQAFTDNGNNTFSFTTTVTTTSTGSIALPITIIDAQSNSASATITLAVAQPAPVVAIHDIQGVKSTTAATISPYAGQRVQTTGIVTTVLSNGFFIQSQSPDSNPLTPEGVDVFTSSAPPATVAVGNLVTVTGTVATFPAVTASHTPATEISGSPTITLVSTGNPLPTPITLTAAMLTPTGGLYQLTPYEGMRVTIASMTAVSGTNGSITAANEPTETATSTGYFYAVITGTARPFREPGIDIRDVPIPGEPANIAQFDDNPERILVDSTIAGGTSLEISTGAVLPNVTGVLDFTFSNDSFYDPSRLILDPTYDRTQVTAGMTVQPVPKPASTEFTVASFNIERFYNTSSSDDLYYVPAGVNGFNGSSSTPILSNGQTFTSEAVDVTQAAYTRRLQKVSLAIRNVLNTPDIVTLEEVENQSVANDIAAQINTDAGIPNLYTAYSTDNSAFYSQDGTGISVGFLIKNSTVDKLGVTQFGQNESFTPTGSSSPITLNDRPWLVLNAGIKRGTAKDYPVTVIVNHMKALTGVNSTTSTSTRQKKELQAEDAAKYIQTLQAAGQHVISGGDFNAFEFSDGYTDTLATYTNTNLLPAAQVVQPGVSGLVTPSLTDLALLLPANQRWSYSEDGTAQILDHMVVTQDLVTAGAHMTYAHLDADFPVTAYNDATTPARTSDHDAAVGYFTLPAPALSAALTPSSATFPSTVIGKSSAGTAFTLTNAGEAAVNVTSITTTGAFSASNNCGSSLAIGATCAINVVFNPTAAGNATGQLQVVTSASSTALTSALTGTGLPLPDFTLADANGKTSTSITLIAGTSGNVTLVITPTSTFAGTVTLTCAATGTAPSGVTCTPPSAFAVATSAVTQNVAFTTTSRTSSSGLSLTGNRSRSITTFTLAMAGLLMLFASRSRRIGNLTLRGAGLFTLLLAICIPSIACSSGAHTNPNGTPAGNYSYAITATGGSVHTEIVTLTVN